MKLSELFKDLFLGEDRKPLMVSFLLERDECSRLLGEFGEKRLRHCSKLCIIWKNGDGNAYIETSESLKDEEAVGMLIKAAHRIADDGNEKTTLFK